MEQSFPAAIAFLGSFRGLAGPALCLLSFASALFLVGILVPVTASMLAAGAAVALGQWPPSVALWAMVGITAGSLLSYEAGRKLPDSSRRAVERKAPRCFALAHRMIERNGVASVIVSRFVGPPATVPFLAGYLGLGRAPFLAAAAISALWVPVVMTIGYMVALGVVHWK